MSIRGFSLVTLALVVLAACADQEDPLQHEPQATGSEGAVATASPTATLPPTVALSPPILRVGGSGEYDTIAEAIESANDGDTIQVAQGTYMENVEFHDSLRATVQGGWNADFTVRNDDSSLTVIDGGANGSVITIGLGPGTNVELDIEGLTIRNGLADKGGGIHVAVSGLDSALRLRLANNTILRNEATDRGGGVYIISIDENASLEATLTGNTIADNFAHFEGGGIRVDAVRGGSTSVTLSNNLITSNAVDMEGEGASDGGGIAAYTSEWGSTTILVENNTITNNSASFGGAIWGYAWGSDEALLDIEMKNNIIAGNNAWYGGAIMSASGVTVPEFPQPKGSVAWRLSNNTIVENTATGGNGGIHLHSGSPFGDGGDISFIMHNDIVWGNTDPTGTEVIAVVEPGRVGTATIDGSYLAIGSIGTFGTGTYTVNEVIQQDPLFVDPINGNYRLQADSPAVDAGDPDPTYADGASPPGLGTRRGDLGAYGGPGNAQWP